MGRGACFGKRNASKMCGDVFREHVNWVKYRMILDYFGANSNGTEGNDRPFDYVLMLDSDATLVQPNLDSVGMMVEELERKQADIFMADEDWRSEKHRGIPFANGGMMLARRSNWTIGLLRHLLSIHDADKPTLYGMLGFACETNEQVCFRDYFRLATDSIASTWKHAQGFLGQDTRRDHEHLRVGSGMMWNRHPCSLPSTPHGCAGSQPHGKLRNVTHVMHFMGGSKFGVFTKGLYANVTIL